MKYSGIVISNPLEMENKIQKLINGKDILERKRAIFLEEGFNIEEIEEELLLINDKIKVFQNIFNY